MATGRPALRRHPETWLLIVAALLPLPVAGLESLSLTAERIEGADWSAQGLRFEVTLDRQVSIHVRQLQLPEPIGQVSNARIDCPSFSSTGKGLSCKSGTATLPSGLIGEQSFPVSFDYRAADGALTLNLTDLPSRAGSLSIAARYRERGWSAQIEGNSLDLRQLVTLATPMLDALKEVNADGRGSINASLSGEGSTLTSFTLSSDLNLDALDALQSRLAAEGVQGQVNVTADMQGDGMHLQVQIQGRQGQFYADPVLVDFTANPGTVKAQLLQHVEGFDLQQAVVQLADAVDIEVKGSINLTPAFAATQADITITALQFPGAYTLLQPFLIGSAADSLETLGSVSGSVRLTGNQPEALDLTVAGLHLDDKAGRFALYDASGDVHWRATELAADSRLQWQGGRLYRLGLDGSRIRFAAGNNRVVLRETLSQPILDGALNITEFAASGIGTPGMRLRFNADVAPIDLTRLTRALGWPEFGGELSGSLPDLEYADQQLILRGDLKARLFDGDLLVENLSIEDPLGDFPALKADLYARNLDLKQATDAFSFGRIEGRFNADVKSLSLLQWRPIAFDARLFTPPAGMFRNSVVVDGETLLDDRPHRISQRAIENISDIGGSGAAGVLSRGFLGFFDDFAYDQISLGCVLRDGVCQMRGLEPKGDGYYIVKGRLLPRIDVIGYASEVSWPSLLAQLEQISKGEGPVVK